MVPDVFFLDVDFRGTESPNQRGEKGHWGTAHFEGSHGRGRSWTQFGQIAMDVEFSMASNTWLLQRPLCKQLLTFGGFDGKPLDFSKS